MFVCHHGGTNYRKEHTMSTNLLQPPATRTSQLRWDAEEGEYVGDISSTNGFGRVYADACDEGITLVSVKTGKHAVFVIDGTGFDNDGDVAYWRLVAVDKSIRFGVTLFND